MKEASYNHTFKHWCTLWKAQMDEFDQEHLCFMNEELWNKDNLIISLLHQLPKQTECLTSLNNRFSNNVTDDNNNNNDNLNHKNNSYANKIIIIIIIIITIIKMTTII